MIMKKLIFALAFCFIAYSIGYSQTKQESVKELFQLMRSDSLIDKMFATTIPAMLKQMQGQTKDSATLARSNELRNSMMQTVKEISKKMINEDMVTLYDKYFTQNEINDLISFYKSPTGQKFIKVTPDIQKEIMTAMYQKYMPEMQKSLKAKTDEMKNIEKK
jgi:uncharacterized protein